MPSCVQGYVNYIVIFYFRKVYSILMLQLLVSVAVISLFLFHEGTQKWVARNPAMVWVALGTTFVLLICMACCGSVRRKAPMNFIFLGIFTCAEAFLLGAISSRYKSEEVHLIFLTCNNFHILFEVSIKYICIDLFLGFVCCWLNSGSMLRANNFRVSNQVGLYSTKRNSFRCPDHFHDLWNYSHVFPWQDNEPRLWIHRGTTIFCVLGIRYTTDDGRKTQVFDITRRIHICCPQPLPRHSKYIPLHFDHHWRFSRLGVIQVTACLKY